MKKVSFTEMKHGTKEDYLFLDKHEKAYAAGTADRILKFMSGLNETLEGLSSFTTRSTRFKVQLRHLKMEKMKK